MRAALAALALTAAACRRGAPPAPPEERREVVEGLILSQSERGRPAWTLRAPLAVMRADDDVALLSDPVMDFHRGGRVVSRARARTGTARTDSHDVRLSSAVVLDSFDDRSRLITEDLLYSASSGRFHTDAKVEVRRPEGVLRGSGLDAAPDLSEIRIRDQRSVLSGTPR
ncbi:MAG: LPS export ABC transporter periplasmic protein LptC [Elusimicrobia bacterium]|nr:LPS export ABC transporter periplasmic protein LptC [Elusimicrobiota bacterium]